MALHIRPCLGAEELRKFIKSVDVRMPSFPDWSNFVARGAPRCLADTFCAVLAAVLLDASWAVAHRIMRKLIEQHLLQDLPQPAPPTPEPAHRVHLLQDLPWPVSVWERSTGQTMPPLGPDTVKKLALPDDEEQT